MNSTYCPNDCTSSWNGDCENEVCKCAIFYSGDDCSNVFFFFLAHNILVDSPSYAIAFWFYSAYTVILNIIMLSVGLYFLYKTIQLLRIKHLKPTFISPFTILIMVSSGAFMRIFVYALDPQNARKILPPYLFELLFDYSIVIWFEAGYLMLIFWLDIALCIRSLKTERFIKARNPLLIGFFLTFAITGAASLFHSFSNGSVAYAIYNAVLIFILLGLTLFVIIFGIKLTKQLKKVIDSKEDQTSRILLNRVVKLMFGATSGMILCAILLALTSVFHEPVPWLILIYFIRFIEFIIALQMLFVVQPIAPKGATPKSSQSHTKKANTSEPTIKDTGNDITEILRKVTDANDKREEENEPENSRKEINSFIESSLETKETNVEVDSKV